MIDLYTGIILFGLTIITILKEYIIVTYLNRKFPQWKVYIDLSGYIIYIVVTFLMWKYLYDPIYMWIKIGG